MLRFLFSIILTATLTAHGADPVRWLEETHNFGAFAEDDGPVSCRMQFINESDRPVLINSVHVTCGCTSPDFDKQPVEPGDTGTVTLTYNPKGRPGRFEKRVYVDLNTTPQRYSLNIKGCVIGSPSTVDARYPVNFDGLRLSVPTVVFGDVTKGRSKSYFLELYNASADTLQPQLADVPSYISAGTPEGELYPGENMSVTLMLASDKINDYGLTTDTLTLFTGNRSQTAQSFKVPLTVMVNEDFTRLTPGQRLNAPAIEISEPMVNFGEVPLAGGNTSRTLTITNNGHDPLIIRRIYTADPGLDIRINSNKIKKGKSATLTVGLDPAKVPSGILNGRIVIISNDPAENVTPVRVVGAISH